MTGEFEKFNFKVHVPNLLNETIQNALEPNQRQALRVPLNEFIKLLRQVSDRAIEINDLKLNQLMVRMTLYENADPSSELYMGGEAVEEFLALEVNTKDD